MTGPRVVAYPDARTFLRRAEGWLMLREDENNLALSLAHALGDAPPLDGPEGYLFATVDVDGDVAGCAFRTPPHKPCLTRMPVDGAAGVARVMADRLDQVTCPEDAGAPFRTTPDTRAGWIARGALFLWEAGGAPVSMALVAGRTRHGVRIGYVFTPRDRRGRGYAGALTAALSQLMLDQGARFCVLCTDLANPTSNALYPRVGYRPLCDELEVEFLTAG